MTMTDQGRRNEPRQYRFGGRQQRGVVMGLTWTQIVALGIGGVMFLISFCIGLPFLFSLFILGASAVFAFAPFRGKKVADWASPFFSQWYRRFSGHGDFRSPLVFVDPTDPSSTARPPVAQEYEGLSFVEALVRGKAMGFVTRSERSRRVFTGTFSVAGPGCFSLLATGDQERLIAQWGRVLAQTAPDADAILGVSVSERALPTDPSEQLAWMDAHLVDAPEEMLADYTHLAQTVAGAAAYHEVHVSVTVASTQKDEGAALSEAVVLFAAFAHRMSEASLPVEVLDERSLKAHLAGWFCGGKAQEVAHPFPVANDDLSDWSRIKTNETWHRVSVVREWPRIDVPATWLEPLLSGSAPVTRSIVLHYRPVTPEEAKSRVLGDVVGNELDRMQRAKWGQVQRTAHEMERDAASDREAELARGEAMHMMAGLVVLSSADAEQLDKAGRWLQAVSNASRLELETLWGQQARALAACVPVGRVRIGSGG
jgi:hypothetical protein